MSDPKPMVITGLVIPSGWDKDGRVAGLTIAAFDEEEYHVRSCADSRKLMMMLHKEIVAEGFMTSTGNIKFLDITEFMENPAAKPPFFQIRDGAKQDLEHW